MASWADASSSLAGGESYRIEIRAETAARDVPQVGDAGKLNFTTGRFLSLKFKFVLNLPFKFALLA